MADTAQAQKFYDSWHLKHADDLRGDWPIRMLQDGMDQAREAALREAAKAICESCRKGHPFASGSVIWHELPQLRGQFTGWSICRAQPILALLGDTDPSTNP